MPKRFGYRRIVGVKGPTARDGTYLSPLDFAPNDLELEERRLLQQQAKTGTRRESYEAQVRLAQRYRVCLVGFKQTDGKYEPGPFDRLLSVAREEVLALCSRPAQF